MIDSVLARFGHASNSTFLATTQAGHVVVYKPVTGQRPLSDFDAATLPHREVLTYRLAEAMGIGVVPETWLTEGPFGVGSAQTYVPASAGVSAAELEGGLGDLWCVAVLDVVANNADRKLGHLLHADDDGRLVAIDHGLTFHVEDKLRTVLWSFAGSRLPPEAAGWLEGAHRAAENELGALVAEWLGGAEADALQRRIESLRRDPVHPMPPVDRPAVPWPVY